MEGAPRVEVNTTMGSFTVELYINHAPKTCKNFIELSKRGYYDNTIVSSFCFCIQILPKKKKSVCRHGHGFGTRKRRSE